MLEDTFESMEDGEEMEEAAEAEVDRILFEITAGEEICSAKPLQYTLFRTCFGVYILSETPQIELYHKSKTLKSWLYLLH